MDFRKRWNSNLAARIDGRRRTSVPISEQVDMLWSAWVIEAFNAPSYAPKGWPRGLAVLRCN